jgi:ParB-like chromosome segregation protein Spo0J
MVAMGFCDGASFEVGEGTMKTFDAKLEDLVTDDSNVRRHGKRNIDAIKASLERFGQQKPIVVDADNVVRAGNGTLEAARELGWDSIACVRSDLAGIELSAFAIADNRTAELASWSDELGAVLKEIVDDNDDLSALGFDADEYGVLLGPSNAPLEGLDDSVIPEMERLSFRCPMGAADGLAQALRSYAQAIDYKGDYPKYAAVVKMLELCNRR